MGININTERAKRAEETPRAPTLEADRVYILPVELPVDTVSAMARMSRASKEKDGEGITTALTDAIKALLGDDWDEFAKANRPSVQDLSVIVAGIPAEYGIGQGESKGSDSP